MNELIVRAALREFLVAALRHVGDASRTSGLPTVMVQRVDFSQKGRLTAPWFREPAYRMLLGQLAAILRSLPETVRVTDAILREAAVQLPQILDDAAHPLTPTVEQAAQLVYDRLWGFLAGWLEDTHSVAVSDEAFDRHYADFRRTWCSGRVTHRNIVPLLFFGSETLPIDLDGSIQIQPLSPETKTSLWQHSILEQQAVSARHIASAEAAIVCSYETASATESRAPAISDMTNDAILALRLLKPGTVCPAAYYDRVESLQVGPSVGSGVMGHWRPLPTRPIPYLLKAPEVGALRSLYAAIRRLRSAQKLGDLNVAIRRFQQTYSRDSPEDQIIDATIGLESTVLFGERTELAYRLALRGACLLREQVPPAASFKLLRTLYDVRSGIVHSGKSVAHHAKMNHIGGLPVAEFVPAVIEWYRILLRFLIARLDNGMNLKAIIKALETSIVTSLSPVTARRDDS